MPAEIPEDRALLKKRAGHHCRKNAGERAMRCIAGCVCPDDGSITACSPEDVLAPEYARRGWQWYNPSASEAEPEPASPPTLLNKRTA